MTRSTFQEFKKEALSDPEVKIEYESLSLANVNSKNSPKLSATKKYAKAARKLK